MMKWGSLAATAEEAVSHNAKIRKRVIMRRGDVPHLTQISLATFPPGEIAAAHSHPDMWEIFLCDAGEGVMTVNGKDIPLKPGTWVVVEPNDVHQVKNNNDSMMVLSVVGVEQPKLLA
jgi:quercetin dioxygenase-like cupin family protein